jgi:kynurenine formamidase
VRRDRIEEKSILELFGELRGRTRMVDLAPRLQSNMPRMSVHPDITVIHDARNHEQHGYYAQSLLMSEHHGAHVDAPIHVHKEMTDATIEDVPLDQLMGPYKKYDLGRFDPQPGQLITRAQLQEEEERAGFGVNEGDIVLVDFGWSRFYLPDEPDWDKRRYWADYNAGLDEDACDYLAGKGIKAICSDTVACDIAIVAGEIQSDFGHKVYFLPDNILICEAFANLAAIPPTGLFLALPLKIDQGSGSPLRPVAMFEPA